MDNEWTKDVALPDDEWTITPVWSPLPLVFHDTYTRDELCAAFHHIEKWFVVPRTEWAAFQTNCGVLIRLFTIPDDASLVAKARKFFGDAALAAAALGDGDRRFEVYDSYDETNNAIRGAALAYASFIMWGTATPPQGKSAKRI